VRRRQKVVRRPLLMPAVPPSTPAEFAVIRPYVQNPRLLACSPVLPRRARGRQEAGSARRAAHSAGAQAVSRARRRRRRRGEAGSSSSIASVV